MFQTYWLEKSWRGKAVTNPKAFMYTKEKERTQDKRHPKTECLLSYFPNKSLCVPVLAKVNISQSFSMR